MTLACTTLRLVASAARRSTIEMALRDAVRRERLVEVRPGTTVTGMLLRDDAAAGVPRIVGVRATDPMGRSTEIPAARVIDGSGRRTAVPGWLEAHGCGPRLCVVDRGISYLSRLYRLLPGTARPRLSRGFTAGASFDGWSCLVFPGDHGTFSVTFGVLPEDRPSEG